MSLIRPNGPNLLMPSPGVRIVRPPRSTPTPQPQFSNVVLLSGFEGTDASASFTDESSFARTLTANGNAQIDTAQAKFGGSSLLLDGTGDFVSAADAAELSIATGQFSIEAWVRIAATGRIHTISNKRHSSGAQEHSLQILTDQTVQFALFRTSTVVLLVSSTALSTGAWHHVAVSRDGSLLSRLFINGVMEASGTQSNTPFTNTDPFLIGRDGFNTSRDFQGWIDEFRMVKGECIYTANFTPPSAAFPRS